MTYTTLKELRNKMESQITRDKDMATKALLKIYEYQTKDEKESKNVFHHNNMGFTPLDAKFLSSIAENLKKGYKMTDNQFYYVQKKIGKYAGQLVKISISAGKIRKEGKNYIY